MPLSCRYVVPSMNLEVYYDELSIIQASNYTRRKQEQETMRYERENDERSKSVKGKDVELVFI